MANNGRASSSKRTHIVLPFVAAAANVLLITSKSGAVHEQSGFLPQLFPLVTPRMLSESERISNGTTL